jgi:hypothetical protein
MNSLVLKGVMPFILAAMFPLMLTTVGAQEEDDLEWVTESSADLTEAPAQFKRAESAFKQTWAALRIVEELDQQIQTEISKAKEVLAKLGSEDDFEQNQASIQEQLAEIASMRTKRQVAVAMLGQAAGDLKEAPLDKVPETLRTKLKARIDTCLEAANKLLPVRAVQPKKKPPTVTPVGPGVVAPAKPPIIAKPDGKPEEPVQKEKPPEKPAEAPAKPTAPKPDDQTMSAGAGGMLYPDGVVRFDGEQPGRRSFLAPVPANASSSLPPGPQQLTLLARGLNPNNTTAVLYVDVPDGAHVTIGNLETQATNSSRYRYYRITGLDPFKVTRVPVIVTLIRDELPCGQYISTCTKYVWLKPGDKQNLDFRPHDFTSKTKQACAPTPDLNAT